MLHYTYNYTYISHGIYCSKKKEKRKKRRNHNEFKFYFQIHIDFYIGIIYSMFCLAENTRISGKIQKLYGIEGNILCFYLFDLAIT